MPDTNTRQAKRAPVTLKIKFKSATLDQFIERYSVDISHGGIFIRTKDPLPVGTALRFEFQLKDASPLITGEGTVVWTREHDPARAGVAPGMGVRFDRLPPDSQQVLDKILERKSQRTPRSDTAAFVDSPTKVAPTPLVNDLAKGMGARTLVGPAPTKKKEPTSPFDVEDVPEEAFEEATKVASLQKLARQTAAEDTIDEAIAEMEQDDPTRRVSLAEIEAQAGNPLPPTEPALRPPSIEDELAARRAAKTEADLEPPIHEDDIDAEVVDEPETQPLAVKPARQPEANPAPALNKTTLSHNPPPAVASPVSTSAPRAKKPSAPPPEKVAAAAAPDQPVARAADIAARGGSSMPMILAAAVLLLAGGAAGWWYLSKNKDEGAKTASANTAAAAGAATDTQADTPAATADTEPTNDEAVVEETTEEPKGTLEATVESKTPGATAELVGGSQQGALPITFKELEDKPYKVTVTADGFLAKEVEIKPGADKPTVVELEPMPKLVRVNSTPEGADLYVNGRKAGKTPHDLELTGTLAKRKNLDIRISMRGYDRYTQKLDVVAAAFEPDGEKLIHDLSATLSKKAAQVRRRTPKRRAPKDPTPDDETPDDETPKDTTPKDTTPKDTTPKDTTPKDKPPKDTTPKDKPPKDKPKSDEPVPDFMKE